MNDESNYPPSGCARCGHCERDHRQGRPRTRADASGTHRYEPPTTDQIKERMLERRADREVPPLPPRDWRMVAALLIHPAPLVAALAAAEHSITPRGEEYVNDQRKPAPTALDHATTCWHETNAAIGDAAGNGNPADPYRYAALLDARAGWWDQLGQLADQKAGQPEIRDTYAIACSFAAELDRQCAAEVRFQYRIPTLHPAGDSARLGMHGVPGRVCHACDRPWQLDRYDACPACPDLLWGITPHSAKEAATYPPGQPWTPHEPWAPGALLDSEDDD